MKQGYSLSPFVMLQSAFYHANKALTNIFYRTLFIAAFIFLMGMVPVKSFAQVTITKPSLTVYACGGTFPTGYSLLGNIVITEVVGSNGDFANGGPVTLI